MELITNDFAKKLKETEFRVVPIPTVILKDLLMSNDKLESAKVICNLCIDFLNSNGYSLTERPHVIETSIIEDLINDDIPYLTEKNKKVYYHHIEIAKVKQL